MKSKEDIAEFLHFVSIKKRDFRNWCYLYVSLINPEAGVSVDEIVQLLGFELKDEKSMGIVFAETNELLFVTPRDNILAINKIEKNISENFGNNVVYAVAQNFDAAGLANFAKKLEPHLDQDDAQMRISFKRLERMPNNIMIVDDDMIVLKQMENVLSGFGNVITVQNPSLFFDIYHEHTPNIVFLDIHLGSAKGGEILKELMRNVDPKAHVVMISSDTMKNTILDIKEGGAKGFVVKPFNRQDLFQHVIKSPTANVRTG